MFAVSGWNLTSGGPKAQIDESTPKKQHTKKKKATKSASDSNAAPISNKRSLGVTPAAIEPQKQRPALDKRTVVTADNVLALYEKLIEGKAVKRSRDRKKRKEKKEKALQLDPAKEQADPVEELQEDGIPMVGGGKKKKRSKPHDEELEYPHTTKDLPDGSPPKKKKKKADREPPASSANTGITPLPPATTESRSLPALTPLQQKMRQKLTSARFRHINEILYTTPSPSSLSLFSSQPEMYTEYHAGFRQQVEIWPENPVDIFIKTLQDRSKVKFERGHNRKWNSTEKGLLPLPRDREEGWCTVADLGCGDAKIAATINHQKPRGKGKVKVLSYDLQASTSDVTIADIAHLPLENESVDIAIFCLALMGTNFLEFIEEAHRILRWRGELWIAEIKSRFSRPTSSKGITVGDKKGDHDDDQESIELGRKKVDTETYKPFIEALARRGFTLRGQVDAGNKMFVRMEFVKIPEREKRMHDEEAEGEKVKGETWKPKEKKKRVKFLQDEIREDQILKPCVYKLR